MGYLYTVSIIIFIISYIKDRDRSIKAIKIGFNIFKKILPLLLGIVVVISAVLTFLPTTVIAEFLGEKNLVSGTIIGSIIGSSLLLPGFITFPLSGMLLNNGVSFTVLSAFTTTLMMVGVVTFPIERKFLGTKLAIVRNVTGLLIALAISITTGLIYGEI